MDGARTGITLVRARQTSIACPSQWDAWDAAGTYYYLRYRFAAGTVSDGTPGGEITSFRREDAGDLDGVITLEEFCGLAGIRLAEGGQ